MEPNFSKEYKKNIYEMSKKMKETLISQGLSEELANNIIDYLEKTRNVYLKQLAEGTLQGPPTGFPSIDKPWLKYIDEESILAEMPKCSMYEKIYKRNKTRKKEIALEYYGRNITYGELFANIDKVSKMLVSKGIKKGDVVSISLPTIPETIYLFYALSKIGAVANMIDPRSSVQAIGEYVKETNSKMFIGVDAYAEKFDDALSDVDVVSKMLVSPYSSLPSAKKKVVSVLSKKENKELLKKFENYEEEISNHQSDLNPPVEKNMSDKAVCIVHTGGTTGPSKSVVLSNYNLNSSIYQTLLSGHDVEPEDTWLNIMPPFIAYGVGNGLHLPLCIGMKVVLIPKFNPAKFADLLIKYKPQHMAGVPSHFENIINNPKLKHADLSFIKTAIVGGDKMNEKLERLTNDFLEKHNSKIHVSKGYGMSEASAAVSVSTSLENNKEKSVGIPFSHTVIGIFDENGNELQYGETGEVCFTGPNTMLEYMNNEEETKKVLVRHEDGKIWVHSGDEGYMDKDGNLFINDRIKRMIVRHDGFKVFPSVIENVVNEIDGVKMCKAIGIRDKEHAQGKLAKVFIVMDTESKISEEELLKTIQSATSKKLSEYYLPIEFEFRKNLPMTLVGKIDYKKLEEEELNKEYTDLALEDAKLSRKHL